MNVTVQMLLRITDPILKTKSDSEIIAAVKRRMRAANWQVLRLKSSEDFIGKKRG